MAGVSGASAGLILDEEEEAKDDEEEEGEEDAISKAACMRVTWRRFVYIYARAC